MNVVTPFSYKLMPITPAAPLDIKINPHSYTYDGYNLYWPDPNTHPHRFHSVAEKAFSQFQNLHHGRAKQAISDNPVTSIRTPLLVPIIQAGQFNIREEESTIPVAVPHSYQKLGRQPTAAGPYKRILQPVYSVPGSRMETPNVDCRIVAASPKVRALVCVPDILLVLFIDC